MAEASTERGPVVIQSDSYNKAEDVLKEHCEEMWKEVKQLQAKLVKIRHQDHSPVTSNASPVLDIYLARQKRLIAQIAVMKGKNPSKLPDNEVIQFECVKEELEKSVGGLQDTLALVRSEQKEVDSEIEKEEHFKVEVEQVKTVLQEKLNEALRQQQAGDNAILIREMQRKELALKKHCKKIMRHMAEFVQKHFPEPNESQLAKWRKQHTPTADDSSLNNVEVLPLIRILQDLLNQCIDSPHNAYIDIDNRFWPPYVELLVRTGIALRNPHNTQQIRLTPFHL
ncbi:hypothetical protein LSH36_15g13045 [Paralvinella palmiformis]|uniref:Centromere protein K n=1 Tax=Paralvinella palmiformis TaxID=53620 RepID=A0AAD9KC78_9ANNE|nr:hypothetical protein LSH36_15g13045 [Paralvinella palmiformis]